VSSTHLAPPHIQFAQSAVAVAGAGAGAGAQRASVEATCPGQKLARTMDFGSLIGMNG